MSLFNSIWKMFKQTNRFFSFSQNSCKFSLLNSFLLKRKQKENFKHRPTSLNIRSHWKSNDDKYLFLNRNQIQCFIDFDFERLLEEDSTINGRITLIVTNLFVLFSSYLLTSLVSHSKSKRIPTEEIFIFFPNWFETKMILTIFSW